MPLDVHPLNVKSDKRGENGKYVKQSQNILFIHKVKKMKLKFGPKIYSLLMIKIALLT